VLFYQPQPHKNLLLKRTNACSTPGLVLGLLRNDDRPKGFFGLTGWQSRIRADWKSISLSRLEHSREPRLHVSVWSPLSLSPLLICIRVQYPEWDQPNIPGSRGSDGLGLQPIVSSGDLFGHGGIPHCRKTFFSEACF